MMFFIWTCIRRPWLARMDRDVECREAISWGLTTQGWREVLGGTYWKQQHPRTPQSSFDVRKFWRHGGSLIFGSDSENWGAVELSPRNLHNGTECVELADFLSHGVKQLVLWDLTLCHAQLQLDRTDEILYAGKHTSPLTLLQRAMRRARRSDLFHDPSWDVPNRTAPWERPESAHQKRHWLSRFVEIIMDWPCASQLQWFFADNGFNNIAAQDGYTKLKTFCGQLSDGKIQLLELTAIAVYYQGVFDALGILATAVVEKPLTTFEMAPFFLI